MFSYHFPHLQKEKLAKTKNYSFFTFKNVTREYNVEAKDGLQPIK